LSNKHFPKPLKGRKTGTATSGLNKLKWDAANQTKQKYFKKNHNSQNLPHHTTTPKDNKKTKINQVDHQKHPRKKK